MFSPKILRASDGELELGVKAYNVSLLQVFVAAGVLSGPNVACPKLLVQGSGDYSLARR